jgi:hypothetical protein
MSRRHWFPGRIAEASPRSTLEGPDAPRERAAVRPRPTADSDFVLDISAAAASNCAVRRWAGTAAWITCAAFVIPSRAQEPPAPAPGAASDAVTDKDRARPLAQDAAELLAAKKYEIALDRVTKAEALYHAPSHLLMKAQALVGLGRLAEALATYEVLVAEPLTSSAPELFRKAQETGRAELRALAERVPSLLVRPGGAGADRASVTVDGQPIDFSKGQAIRFDPGSHRIEVTAEGFAPFSRDVELPPRGGVVLVDAPLVTAGVAPTPATGGRGSIVPALVAFGIGAVGIGVGAVTGIMSLGKTSDLKDRCPDDRCTPAEQGDLDSASTLATISTIGFGVGIAGVAAGVVLLVVRPKEARVTARRAGDVTTSVGFAPWVGVGSAGVGGRF